MKSKIKKFLTILLIAILFAPQSYANGDDGDHFSQEMAAVMSVMMLTMAGLVVYSVFYRGPRRMMSTDEVQKNYQPILPANYLFISPQPGQLRAQKIDLVSINYTF